MESCEYWLWYKADNEYIMSSNTPDETYFETHEITCSGCDVVCVLITQNWH